MALIEAKNISKTFRSYAEDVHAVSNVSLAVKSGDFLSIMGPSGSGKTSLLDMLGCLDHVTEGEINIAGENVSEYREKELVKVRRKNFGFVFQEFLLINSLTAVENVEVSLRFSREGQDRAKVVRLLERLGLGHRLNHLPKYMSGGERQRVAIARALVPEPKILIADEPTGNLDTKNSQSIFDLFKKLNEDDQLTIILATHDTRLGNQAKQVIKMEDGRISL